MQKYLIIFNIFFMMNLIGCSVLNFNEKGIIVEKAWARPAMQGNPSAVYFRIENNLKEKDKLLSVNSQVAEFNEIHLSKTDNGTMMMMKQDFVEIDPGQVIEFKPMSYHIMLINLNQDLKVGDNFDISLNFEKSGQKVLNVEVKENE